MKSTDVALIILISVMSIGLAFWISNMVIGNPMDKVVEVQYISEIQGTVAEPDSETFNVYAYNYNEDVMIGRCKDDEEQIAGKCYKKDSDEAKKAREEMGQKQEENNEENNEE